LVEKYGLKQISTGDLFRKAIKEETKYGVIAKYFISFGYLVPDDFTIQMVQEYLQENINSEELKNGFILDGFPRTIVQAIKLEDMCHMFNFKIDAVMNLDIPEDVLIKRLSGRRTCVDCGKSYHIVYNPPKEEGICDTCGGELQQRADESEEAVQVRIDTYNKQTKPLIDYYKMKNELININGDQAMEDVTNEIYKILDNL
ncbi:MAG: adenylate kinase family protein, partial [Faecalibacillus sp.]